MVSFSMLLTVFNSGCTDLDSAYNCGNEIRQHAHPAPSGLATEQLKVVHDPVVIGQTTPGAGNLAGHELLQALRDASVVASGFSLTPNLVNSFAFTAIGPGIITMQGSGAPGQQAASINMQVGNGQFGGSFAVLSASGIFGLSANGAMIINQNGGTGPLLIENKGNGYGLGGQLQLSAFNGSGQLEYRFGAHEAWHWKPSYELLGGPAGDGFHPIPHSGQIEHMILAILKRYGLI